MATKYILIISIISLFCIRPPHIIINRGWTFNNIHPIDSNRCWYKTVTGKIYVHERDKVYLWWEEVER